MRNQTIATMAILFSSSVAGVSPALGQSGYRSTNRTVSQSGTVSQDLLAIYQQTKAQQTVQSVTIIARACTKVISDPSRNKADREYASSLLAWALNRRGEMRNEQAAKFVQTNNLSAADKLDRQAAEDFRTAIEYGPANWRVHHNYAISLAMQGDYQKGIAEFTRAIELQPEYANAYFNRAELYFEQGEYADAERGYLQAISIKAGDPQFHNSLAHCRFMMQDYEQAILAYRQAAELATDSAVYLTDLADAYHFSGDWQAAAETYQQAVAVNNQYARAYQHAAWLMATCPQADIRDQQLALSAAKRAIDLEGEDSAKALDTLAAATANSGDFTKAAELLRKAIGISEDDNEIAEFEQRLNLYSQRRAYRQTKSISVVADQEPPSVERSRIRTASSSAPNDAR